MLIPYNVDVPMKRYPIANWVLIGVTVVISMVLMTTEWKEDSLETLAHWWVIRGEYFRFISLIGHLFAHADIMHLLGNMLFLFVFGNAVNAKLGHWQFLALYFLGGILAGTAWLCFDGGIALLGASGAIMGIVGVYLVLYPLNDISVFWWFYFRAGTFQLSGFWVVLLYIGFDIWGMIKSSLHIYSNVAYISHLTGMTYGVALMATLVYLGYVTSDYEEQNIFQCFDWPTRKQKQAATLAALTTPPANAPSRLRPYLITGTDRASGFKTSFTIHAISEQAARSAAAKEDLVVTCVETLP